MAYAFFACTPGEALCKVKRNSNAVLLPMLLGAHGPEFELIADLISDKKVYIGLTPQLPKQLQGLAFTRLGGAIAQLGERQTEDLKVIGSIPICPKPFCDCYQSMVVTWPAIVIVADCPLAVEVRA